MKKAKAEKIKKGIDDKIRKSTVDMEWWANFWGFTVDEYEEFLNMAVKAVEQEQKRGEWIDRASELDADFGRHDYVCSKCFKRANYYVGGSTDWWDRKRPNYCPNCGARMESDGE